jgi:uncharacterized protein (UPF0332 family)
MKFDWSEYFNLANQLVTVETNEAKQRSSISRAYYAAFCLARNYLRDYQGCTRLSRRDFDANVHQYVAEEFNKFDPKNKRMVEIGRDLERLRSFRNNADYEDTIFSLQKNTLMSLRLAQNIIDNINRLMKD